MPEIQIAGSSPAAKDTSRLEDQVVEETEAAAPATEKRPASARAAGKRQAGKKAGAQTSAAATEAKATTARAKRKRAADASARAKGAKATRAAEAQAAAEDDIDSPDFDSKSVAQIRREARREQAKQTSRRRMLAIVAAIGVVVVLLAGWAALYNSPAFTIRNVEVNGVEHLTSDEMAQLANVPSDTTLLRVDTATVKRRVEQNAWVAEANVELVFPDTLRINVTEREVYAVVEIPTSGATAVKQWAISSDRVWLMPVPDADSEAAKTTSSRVYEDASSVLHIVEVPIGTKAEIGAVCTDSVVNNALDIISGLTTELADRVAEVSAAGVAETTLILDNGIEIAFGQAEDIRDKERVVLEILDEHPNNVVYINVRLVETPTWRAV